MVQLSQSGSKGSDNEDSFAGLVSVLFGAVSFDIIHSQILYLSSFSELFNF